MADFRAERMPSPEGEGRAKSSLEKAWDAYHAANKAVNTPLLAAFPGLKSLMRGYANSTLFDLFGFWLLWQLAGGFEGLQKTLGMSRSSVYRRISQFRAVFGEHPDVYEFPGVTVDVEAFVQGMAERAKES
ncbi:MAG: hypothetical protein EPN48_14310 [Microbacteriaceae bacterium]|nr:MAG: hypothetical protein EPN48_14310 [Microbacteriaceae bacterium]